MSAPTADEFRSASLARARQTDVPLTEHQRRMALYALGIAGEAGEVCDEVKKHLFHDKPLDPDKIVNECGDVLWYLDRVLMSVGATMSDAMQANMDKLARRYPDGFDAAAQKFGFTAAEGA